MKKIIIILVCFLFILVSVFCVKTELIKETSVVNTSGYAQVKSYDTFLRKYPSSDESCIMFLLEKSYFVKVLEQTNENFLKVKYLNFEGYVSKDSVEHILEIPTVCYLENITFDLLENANLRNLPLTSSTSKINCTIKADTKNIEYIGKIAGEESIAGLGNIWYYCKYTSVNNVEFYGYIYSPLTTNLSNIPKINETYTVVNINAVIPSESLLYLNINTKSMILIVLAIPAVIILILLFIPLKKRDTEQL